MAKIIKNISSINKTYGGVFIPSGVSYSCLDIFEASKFYSDSYFLTDVVNGEAEVYNDSVKVVGISNVIKFLIDDNRDSEGYTITKSTPFASKNINGKKLFKRIHGVQIEAVVGENIVEFSIPYNVCKITGMEMIGGSNCDKVDLEVYDTPTGTVSTIPNYKLNQFGFSVNVSKDYYEHKSEYDADLIKDMKLEVHYWAKNAGVIGINFILNELK